MKTQKKNWIVRIKCEVVKDVYCDNCTEEQARNNPFDHATNEVEVDQTDYDVKSVEENK